NEIRNCPHDFGASTMDENGKAGEMVTDKGSANLRQGLEPGCFFLWHCSIITEIIETNNRNNRNGNRKGMHQLSFLHR
ncbi:hypothetical protein KKI24_01045, partial [bacterium]|nr:hypothetical protein [bacterium]